MSRELYTFPFPVGFYAELDDARKPPAASSVGDDRFPPYPCCRQWRTMAVSRRRPPRATFRAILAIGSLTILGSGIAFRERLIEYWRILEIDAADAETRYRAVHWLASRRVSRSAPWLLERAFEEHEAIERSGIPHEGVVIPYYVGVVRDFGEEAVPALIDRLGESECRTALAAKVLGDLGRDARAAVPALRRHADDPSDIVRRSVAAALERIESR